MPEFISKYQSPQRSKNSFYIFLPSSILPQDLEKIPDVLGEILKTRIKVDNTLEQLKKSKGDDAAQSLVLVEAKSFVQFQ